MEGIRLATQEEIDRIKTGADLGPTTSVIAWSGKTEEDTILAVLRQATELEPVYFNGAAATRKAMFIWGVENMLRFLGTKEYYFNMPTDDASKEWRETVTHWGAEQVSVAPELRFKKVLLADQKRD